MFNVPFMNVIFNYKYQNFKIFAFYHFLANSEYIYELYKIQHIKKNTIDEINRVKIPSKRRGHWQ